MIGVLPEWIAIDSLLVAGGRLRGRVALGSLHRLAELRLHGQVTDPAAKADLNLVQDSQGRHRLQGKIRTRLELQCERCQGPVEWPIEAGIDLYLVSSETAAAALGEEAEYVIVEGNSLRIHELIEDELILALPLVAKHPQGSECGNRSPQGPLAESGERDNPFAILKQLKI